MMLNFKKKQKLLIFLAFAVSWIFIIFIFRSCDKMTEFNDIESMYLRIFDDNGKTYISGADYPWFYEINPTEKAYTLEGDHNETLNALFEQQEQNHYYYSYFSDSFGSAIPEGYEGVIPHVEGCKLDTKRSVIESVGYVDGDILTGFVRVYKRAYLRHFHPKDIDHSLIFTYNSKNNEFTICHTLDDVLIAGFYKDDVIYWKDRKFYKYNLKSGEEVFLTEDKGYDAGSTQWSYSEVYYNSEICVIYIAKRTYTQDAEYMYVYDWAKDSFYELNQK